VTNFEGSVVRPKFGRQYKMSISEKAIRQIIWTTITDTHRAITIRTLKIKWVRSEACRINVLIDVGFMKNISSVVFDIEKRIRCAIEESTGLIVEMVDVSVDSVESNNEKS
jgi:2-phosphoglycerate kinase